MSLLAFKRTSLYPPPHFLVAVFMWSCSGPFKVISLDIPHFFNVDMKDPKLLPVLYLPYFFRANNSILQTCHLSPSSWNPGIQLLC